VANRYFRWYRRVVLLGAGANLSFAVTALCAPARLQRLMGLKPLAATVWLRNVGMLLVIVSMFNVGAAMSALRYPLYSWFVPIARLIAATFFFRVSYFNPADSSERPRAFLPLFVFDLTMGVVGSVLLALGFRRERQLGRPPPSLVVPGAPTRSTAP